MQLVVTPERSIRCIYGEQLDLSALGRPVISRGSHVEPDQNGRWSADLSPIDGPQLGPFDSRSQAVAAEVRWLERHWLTPGS